MFYLGSPRHRHSCLKCGFLSFDGGEASYDTRATIAARGGAGWFVKKGAVYCFKKKWLLDVNDADDIAINECNRPRFYCSGFRSHSAGRTPEQHQKLEDEDREFHRRLMLAALAAIVALVVGWLGLKHH